jgi:hypothetical protein
MIYEKTNAFTLAFRFVMKMVAEGTMLYEQY